MERTKSYRRQTTVTPVATTTALELTGWSARPCQYVPSRQL